MEKLYTVLEAAEILRVRRDTVYNLIKRGDLPAIRMGRVVRIPESAFRAAGNTAAGNTAPEKSEPPDKRPVILKIRP